MKTIKNLGIVATLVAFVFALSSCNKQTCPTYSKTDSTTTESRV